MHEVWLEFAKVAAAHLLAVISPGPDFAMVLRQSLAYGRRVGFWTSIGIGSAILLHVTYSLLGLGLLIRGSVVWFNVLKWIGAVYLAWVGVQALLAPRESSLSSEMTPRTAAAIRAVSAFRTGFLTNALNPKVTLFFVALFAAVINPATPKAIQAAYGAWMSLATMAWFCLVTALCTRADVRSRFLRNGYWVNRILGVVLIGFAIGLALTSWK